MNIREGDTVVSKDGVRGIVTTMIAPTADRDAEVMLRFDNGWSGVAACNALVRRHDGTYYLGLNLDEVVEKGGENGERGSYQRGKELVVPIIEETIQVEKRTVTTGGVRITKQVREREEVIDTPLLRERVEVERVAVNRYIDTPATVYYEGETMVIPVVEEVLVVEKRLVLKEEIRITKYHSTEPSSQRVVVRSEDAVIERLGSDNEP